MGHKFKLNVPLKDRLLENSSINMEYGCMEWIAGKDRGGYGIIKFANKNTRAHRAAYELWIGQIPEGMCVLHKCDNPSCINPEHLFLGTQQDNMIDMSNKGRSVPAICNGENNGRAKLTEGQVIQIRAITGLTHREISDMFGIKRGSVTNIRLGKTWKHLLTKENAINKSV